MIAATVVASSPAGAQLRPPSEGGTTVSLGQPGPWKWSAGVGTGWRFREGDGQGLAEGRIAVSRDLLNPLFSLGVGHAEVYAGSRDADFDHGFRAAFVSPFLRLGIGVDYNGRDDQVDLLLSLLHPGRRGGLFRDGTVARVDYVPGRDHSVVIGIERPVLRRIPMGSTRPRRDHVRLPRPDGAPVARTDGTLGIDEPLARAREAAGWIRRLTVPFIEHSARRTEAAEAAMLADLHEIERHLDSADRDDYESARGVEREVRRYHAEVERAFSLAIAGQPLEAHEATAEGRQVAARAREILLAEVLLPYNRLLGQAKQVDTVRGFGGQARGLFLRWLHLESGVPPEAIEPVLWVFTELVEIVEANRAAARRQWGDSRLVWLPLQYALLPEQHDTQAKLDALIEQAVGARFTEGNFVSWVVNEQFQYQLSRTIREAEEYHVLWIHDFRGTDVNGDPDEMSYAHVLRSYLATMTDRVRAYDRTGRFPVYLILLDEWFYQVNRGWVWVNVLEDPTGYRLRLPLGYEAWEDSIAGAQATLRTAIAESTLLQAQRREYGDAWLRNLIKVHVNITNPADPSFWSSGVIPLVPLPDNMMRDHRKVAFYDITEEDPYRGEALYTGAGVGEHYANLSWEDRSLLVRGPAVLGLKAAARQALLNQGIAPHRIAYPLQPRAFAADYDARVLAAVQENQQPLRALELHNGTGFDDKPINVVKTMLYTLMPPGSVINIPDSLWSSGLWGSALLGCALRGGRVLIIAPAAGNAPASGFGTLGRSHALFRRLLIAERLLEPEIAAAGGLLRVGLYAPAFEVTDIPAKVRSVHAAFAEHAWLRDLFDFPPSVFAGLAELTDALGGLTMAPAPVPEFEYDPRPKLHLKANFFASREAWQLMSRPEWTAVSWEYTQQRIAQVQTRPAAILSFEAFPEALIDVGGGMVQSWLEGLEPGVRERVVFYTLMGSQNQNYRSMIVDGEVGLIVADWPPIIPYLDLISLIGQSRWMRDPPDLTGLLPAESGWGRRIARWIRVVL